MHDLKDWVRHGDEIRRPLLVNPELSKKNKIIIVGGGLSGLCAAFRISEKFPNKEIIILEKTRKLGGVIHTWIKDEWICDISVNSSRPHPAVWRLISDLGLEEHWRISKSEAKYRWLYSNGKRSKLSISTVFKIGPIKLFRGIKNSRKGEKSVLETIRHKIIADAFTLGIVNDTSNSVDADFLIPSVTNFGETPPIKKNKLNKMINKTYEFEKPIKKSTATLKYGMEQLTEALIERITNKSNISVEYDSEFNSISEIMIRFKVDECAIIWASPKNNESISYNHILVFAVGYKESANLGIPLGFGTLIPDNSIPISGILHESDVHYWNRAPQGSRLFRVMVPSNRFDGNNQSIKNSLKNILTQEEPDLFEFIGKRRIPKYPPGHLLEISKMKEKHSWIGWSAAGVSITHVIDECERLVEKMLES